MKKGVIAIIIIVLIAGWATYTIQRENNKEKTNQDILNSITQEKNNHNELLLQVLNNQVKAIDENNNEILFKNFKIPGNEVTQAESYSFVDLDKDGTEELVILTTSDYGAYVVLHYENNAVYGYLIGLRSFENLKIDGSFNGSNGANSNEYSTISFAKNRYTIKAEAVFDEANDVYKINNEKVSKEKIDEYVINWNKKQNVEWTNYIKSNSESVDKNITKEDAERLLIEKYGSKDEETGNIMSYGYMAIVKDDQGNQYYAFRHSWLVDNSHLSFLQNVFVSLDGKSIRTSTDTIGFEENQVVKFNAI